MEKYDFLKYKKYLIFDILTNYSTSIIKFFNIIYSFNKIIQRFSVILILFVFVISKYNLLI